MADTPIERFARLIVGTLPLRAAYEAALRGPNGEDSNARHSHRSPKNCTSSFYTIHPHHGFIFPVAVTDRIQSAVAATLHRHMLGLYMEITTSADTALPFVRPPACAVGIADRRGKSPSCTDRSYQIGLVDISPLERQRPQTSLCAQIRDAIPTPIVRHCEELRDGSWDKVGFA